MTATAYPKDVIYPESDGQPIADNTIQLRWILTILGELDSQFIEEPDVFVAGDLLWYPVEFHPEISAAPDVLVAFGRPKGDRGSYKQFEEGGIAPQVAFEILSPSNRAAAMREKYKFYEKYGVEEYYIYDPERGTLKGYLRSGGDLVEIPSMRGWVSPRLKIRFEMVQGDLEIQHPDGRQFAYHTEIVRQRDAAEAAAARSKAAAAKARIAAEKAEAGKRESDAVAERLRARLRALGIDDA